MKRTFLYKLFKYSKTWFLLVVGYLICFTVFFCKKMDTVVFPYNSMFTIDFTKDYSASTYLVKVNNIPVGITRNLYWKKDFLEESLHNYYKYKSNIDAVFIEGYLKQSISNKAVKEFLLKQLCPGKLDAARWLRWYVSFAGYNAPGNSTIELLKYDFIFRNNKAIIIDSVSIYKTVSF